MEGFVSWLTAAYERGTTDPEERTRVAIESAARPEHLHHLVKLPLPQPFLTASCHFFDNNTNLELPLFLPIAQYHNPSVLYSTARLASRAHPHHLLLKHRAGLTQLVLPRQKHLLIPQINLSNQHEGYATPARPSLIAFG